MQKVVVIVLALLFHNLPLYADTLRDREAASALIKEAKWDMAQIAFERLVATNPYDGRLWYQLGLARARQGDCKTAQVAIEKAISLGIDGVTLTLSKAHIEAAACALSLGNKLLALSHLATVNGPLARRVPSVAMDPRFAPLAADPLYLKLSGQLDYKSLDRIRGWRADLAYFDDLARRRHQKLFHTVSKEKWRDAVADLHKNIPKLTDAEVVRGFVRLAAMVGDGHTSIYPATAGPAAMHMLPIWPQALGENWVIVAADPERSELVVAKILRINGNSADPNAQTLIDVVPRDNSQTPLWLGSYVMQFAEGASGAYGTPTTNVTLELALTDGNQTTIKLDGGPVNRDPSSRWAPEGWPTMGDSTPRPLWLTRTQDPFWFVDVSEIGAVYAQITQVNDAPGIRYAEFALRLGKHLRSSGATCLILDLRHNNGGNADLNWSIVKQIVLSPQVDQTGSLFVITGRRTFSASQSLITMLEELSHPIFVGEPASSRPSSFGESHPMILPWSGLRGSISNEWHQGWAGSLDSRPWIPPDIAAPPTADSIRTGRDPAMETIAAYLGTRRAREP